MSGLEKEEREDQGRESEVRMGSGNPIGGDGGVAGGGGVCC